MYYELAQSLDGTISRAIIAVTSCILNGAEINVSDDRSRGRTKVENLAHEILAFIKERLSPGQPIRARDLAALVRDEFGLDVHPRTIERAISGKKTVQ